MPRFQVVSPVGTYKTIKQINFAAARAKGDPVFLNSLFSFAFDAAAAYTDHVLVYGAQQVQVNCESANGHIALVSFLLGEKVYWNNGTGVVTNVSAGATLIGRSLEDKNLIGGVPLGTTLLIELNAGA